MLIETDSELSLTIKERRTIMDLKDEYPNLFYPQDWYEHEGFANFPAEIGTFNFSKDLKPKKPNPSLRAVVATHLYVEYMRRRGAGVPHLWGYVYVWTGDTDGAYDPVYVGGCCRGERRHGFQIHRHLTVHSGIHKTVSFEFHPS